MLLKKKLEIQFILLVVTILEELDKLVTLNITQDLLIFFILKIKMEKHLQQEKLTVLLLEKEKNLGFLYHLEMVYGIMQSKKKNTEKKLKNEKKNHKELIYNLYLFKIYSIPI